jgi:ATP-binding cassette subfamily F protein 3
VTTRIVRIRDGRAEVHQGGFKESERAEREASSASSARAPAATRKDGPARPAVAPPVDGAQDKYEAQRQAARSLEKKKRRVQELELTIGQGERELDALRGRLREAPGEDWEKLATMAREEQVLAKKVDAMLVEWARLSEEVQ